MFRRELLCSSATIGTFALAGCLNGDTDSAFDEGFEQGMVGWESGATIGSDVDLTEFEWEVEVSGAQARTGDQSLRVWNEGSYDDGVTWATHPVSVPTGQVDKVTVTAQFWSESESFNLLRDAVMRLGPKQPEKEEDFPDPGVNTTALGQTPYGGLREPLWLTSGWKEYSFTWTQPSLSTDTLYLSIGTAVVWESDLAHFLDDITVEFEER